MFEKETTAKQINEVIDHVFDKAKEVSGDLQPLAETIITEYVKTNIIYSIGCSLGVIIILICFTIIIKYMIKIFKSDKSADNDKIITLYLGSVSMFMLIIGFIFCLVNGIIYFAHAIAPHYHILKDLAGK